VRRQAGTTLVEILISLAVVLVGMLALFRTLASSVVGASSASRVSQAQLRAEQILEDIRVAPTGALICLASTTPDKWSTCEAICKNFMAKMDPCIYTITQMASLPGPDIKDLQQGKPLQAHGPLDTDRSMQAYGLAFDGTQKWSDTFVRTFTGRVFLAQIAVGWNDNNLLPSSPNTPYQHVVTLSTGVFH
jgi:hypothetical protein